MSAWHVASGIAVAASLCAGCAPLLHTIEPYRSDPAQAAAIEARAAQSCRFSPQRKFTTDGCSMFPDGDWVQCCVEHDLAYWCGGSAARRLEADRGLQDCVAALGQPDTAWWMKLGVRVGGHPWWPFPWRWGYGWDWPHGYEHAP